MLVKVVFHGFMKKLCGDFKCVEATTPAEAIRGVTSQIESLKKRPHKFTVKVKECPEKDNLYSEIITEELNLYPAFMPSGGKAGGILKIVVGVILIAVGVIFSGFSGGASSFLVALGWSLLATACATAGSYLLNQGIAQLITKKENKYDVNNPEASTYFNIRGNTTKIGTRIAIGYGRYKVYGHLLSLGSQASNHVVLNR